MNEPRRSRRRGCPTGCLIALGAFVIVAVLVGYFAGAPIRAAKRTEQDLNDRFGWATDWTPPPDGAPAPVRMEAFLRVRERMIGFCGEFQELSGQAASLDSLAGNEAAEDLSTLGELLSGLRRLAGRAPRFLAFMEARHTVLLAEEMGLGEYIYLYVLAYGERLGPLHQPDEVDGAGRISARTRRELTAILRNQLAALAAAGEDAAPAGFADALHRQIADLEDGRLSYPWQDGLPDHIAAALAPFAGRLAGTFCPGLANLELMQKNRGLDVSS